MGNVQSNDYWRIKKKNYHYIQYENEEDNNDEITGNDRVNKLLTEQYKEIMTKHNQNTIQQKEISETESDE